MVSKEGASYKFFFEGRKEALCHRVVPAITFSTHACKRSSASQSTPKLCTRVLASSVRMEDERLRKLAVACCHIEGIIDQIRSHARSERPANHSTRVQVDDHSE